jgi:tetratricopeptide (TPR) repeat protein
MNRPLSLGWRKLAAATILGLTVLGLGFGSSASRAEDAPPVESAAKADPVFDKLFNDGVAYMRAGKLHEAIIVFETARKRQPKIPEVPVNLGYAHLAAKNYPAALANFEQALTIAPRQVNAYYGLAIALQGKGELEAAISAMNTYRHFQKEESPYTRKADAALWEWEEELRVKQGGAPMPIPEHAVGAKDKQPVTSYDQLRKDTP